jgi:SET and MYND domain-containing protein
MQIQQVVTPPKPPRVVKPLEVITPDSDLYVHPHLTPDTDPCKGRLLRASASIRAGTVVLRDVPYAVVPTVNPSTPDYLICSSLTCSRSVAIPAEKRVRCPKCCDQDVIWCDRACQAADHKRHEYECLWLKHKGAILRRQESQYDFITLWHVVRLLAGWSLEIQGASTLPSRRHPRGADFKWGWEAVLMCCDYLDSWPEAQIKHWKRLAEAYMDDKSLLPCPLSPAEMLSLICKEETNTFGLYRGITGPLSMVDRPVPRGESYGLGLYPRAAMFNHSCEPNASLLPLCLQPSSMPVFNRSSNQTCRCPINRTPKGA